MIMSRDNWQVLTREDPYFGMSAREVWHSKGD
jgi:hypothetical protein